MVFIDPFLSGDSNAFTRLEVIDLGVQSVPPSNNFELDESEEDGKIVEHVVQVEVVKGGASAIDKVELFESDQQTFFFS